MRTPEDLLWGLRLDYDGTTFSPNAKYYTVLEFELTDGKLINTVYGDGREEAMDEVSGWGNPFTGNGFLSSSNGQIMVMY